jgi:hypothetical protein
MAESQIITLFRIRRFAMFLIVIVLVLMIIGAILIVVGFDNQRGPLAFLGILLMALATVVASISCFIGGRGQLESAEGKLSPGETYECITVPKESDDICYSIVKTGNGNIYGLRFREIPPQKGMVSKTGNKIAFLPIVDKAERVTIEKPLPGAETPKPASSGK